MTSTTTSRLQANKPDVGSENNTWGTMQNGAFDVFDRAIAGYLTKSVAGAIDVTLSATEALNPHIVFTGIITANINVIVPALERNWHFWNNTTGSFTLTVKTASGTGAAITQTQKAKFACDATNAIKWADEAGTITAFALTILDDTTAATMQATLGVVGRQTLPISAGGMRTRTTTGAAAGTAETTTNKHNQVTYDFDASTQEHVQFEVTEFPKGWNLGTITAIFHWMAASGSGDVIFGIQAVAMSDGDALDAAFGTAQEVTDTLGTANTERRSAESSAMTIAGTPAVGDRIMFQIYRKAAAAGDTLAVDAKLIGVTLFFTTTLANDT